MTEKSLKLQDREVVNTTTEVRRYKTMGSPRFGMADTRSYLATHSPTEQSLKLQPHVHFHPIRGYSTFVILTIHCFSFPFSAHSMSLSTTIRAANTAAASITQVVTDLRVSGDNVATEWLGSEDDLRVELLLDSSVAGFIFLDPDSNFNAASLRCRSSQPDSWACNLSNDMRPDRKPRTATAGLRSE